MVWKMHSTGLLTVKDAYETYRCKRRVSNWLKKLWQIFLPPKLSVFAWKFLKNVLPTERNANDRGVTVNGGRWVCGSNLMLED